MSREVGFNLIMGAWVVLAMAWMVFLLWSAGVHDPELRSPGVGIRLRLKFAAGVIPLGVLLWWLAYALHLVE
jgi:hypothetical protein